MLKTLEECTESEPNRKCFRLIGGVLVERTVTEVAPQIKTNREGVSMSRGLLASLTRLFRSSRFWTL